MHWKGYTGRLGAVGGAFGCDGAIPLQGVQWALNSVMADDIPGQNTDDSALEDIVDTPW